MTYKAKNCSLYAECIAISSDAASFNVEIFHTICDNNEKIGKANVLVSRRLTNNDTNSISLMINNGRVDNSDELFKNILSLCVERCKALNA